eukprot:Tbor_TRINITY_DN4159_c1_g1::TRINITY_DN4159_c1_g1_i1::g.26512::m.26512/K20790/NME5; nucleoside diphosphate kinase homolog 5
MTFDGTITKALLILPPKHCTKRDISVVRHKLYEDGFIVVREEYRRITMEIADKITHSEPNSTICSQNLYEDGNDSYVIVVARSDAAIRLIAFRQECLAANLFPNQLSLFVYETPQNAAKAIITLFPKMLVDPIPTDSEAREYIQIQLKTAIVDALTETAKNKPDNVIEYFARYLLDHNQQSPPVFTQE